ncbi:MAG: Efflux transporter, RND family, MFP subunit [Candidatus Woesebacteria bacterium GW2011_GWA2_40_7b]|uniref:Efflux transporter, RND family, MFP subunit n=1 Tax=Candidatus Woesebacteria bacterium GW2011_GWA2_40_7b TaxID=1618563 RepID=A0A0G0VGN5_9BACT|nr:MAG: Efflux transporter, RND family, MFP subunit [Candidatus Woesebacteria bacterium GW2011_GWA2_40_7b]
MNKLKLFWTWITKDRKRIIGAIVLVILIILGIWKLAAGKGDGVTYQTSKVEKGTIVSSVSASGQVLTTNILSITTEASGVVKKVYVKDGDKVTAGQKLAEITLDTAGLDKNAQAYDSYVNALNGVNSSRNSYRSAVATAEKVLDEVKGHDTDETLTQKETRTKAEVARDNAYDGLRQADANLTSASYSYRSTTPIITAPFAGVIGSVNLVEGMILESASSTTSINSQRVAVIKGDSLPVISVSLSEVDVPKVEVGQKAIVSLDSISNKTFTGKVATVDRVGTTTSNVTSYTAKIKLDSASAEILPNMAATANIVLETKTDVLTVPSSAVSTQDGTNFVKTLKDGKEVNIPVEIGISSDSEIEITSGVGEGDTVITGTVSASKTSNTQTRSVFSGGFGTGGGPR